MIAGKNEPYSFNRLPKCGVFIIFIQHVMKFFWCFKNRIESVDADKPWVRLKSTSANSNVAVRYRLVTYATTVPRRFEGCRFTRYQTGPCSSSLLEF